jgi:hypothetical protein
LFTLSKKALLDCQTRYSPMAMSKDLARILVNL